MQANRRILPQSWCATALLAAILLAAACGGTDAGRPAPTPEDMLLNVPLENCALEASIAPADYRLVKSGAFETAGDTGWSASVDGSPMPANAARPIKSYCPQDSRFDCCMTSDDVLWSTAADQLTQEQQAQLAEEQRLQAGYHCAPDAPDTQYCPALGLRSITTQALGEPITCKAGQPPGKALHIRAARYTDWGAQVYLNFDAPGFDASSYDGISFWVRLGQGGTQPVGHDLFIGFDDVFTKEGQNKFAWQLDANGKYLLEPNANGDPVPVPVLDAAGKQKPIYVDYAETQAKNCYDVGVDTLKCDRFGVGVGLEMEWRFVKIPFKSMRQRGYGVPSPAGRVLREALLSFDIYMDIGNWDFWIDQVAFYRESSRTSAP